MVAEARGYRRAFAFAQVFDGGFKPDVRRAIEGWKTAAPKLPETLSLGFLLDRRIGDKTHSA